MPESPGGIEDTARPHLIATDNRPFSARDILDIDRLSELFDSYSNITGIAAALLDLDGTVLIASNWKDSCTQFHRRSELTRQRCLQSDTALANDLSRGSSYTVYHCKNGLVDVATPVIIGGYHIANVFIGQFFFQPPDLAYYQQLAEDAGFDLTAYLNAIQQVPIFTEDEVRRNMDFIVKLAGMIGETGVQHLEISKANEDLIEARDHAEVASKAKSQFLSRMSHELRTPLNAVLGFSELLRMDMPSEDTERQELVEHITDAGQHLLSLIVDIMDVVSLDNRKLNIPLTDIALQHVFDESLAIVRPLAQEHSINLQADPTQLVVQSNFLRLKQVCINLLSNAIKYNDAGGSVTIRAELIANSRVRITVTDTGVGIDPADADKLFQPFSRLAYAENNAIQGAGIGLSLCKYLVDEMRGDIALEHSPPGLGAIFSVTLPAGTDAKAGSTEQTPNTGIVSLDQDICGSILYIEDSATNRKLLQMVSDRYPSLVFATASCAEDGINLAEQMLPSLIIMDINLPQMSGIDAVRCMRQMEQLQHCRIVALSADALPSQSQAALEAGFDDYLTKPIDLPAIIALFRSIRARVSH